MCIYRKKLERREQKNILASCLEIEVVLQFKLFSKEILKIYRMFKTFLCAYFTYSYYLIILHLTNTFINICLYWVPLSIQQTFILLFKFFIYIRVHKYKEAKKNFILHKIEVFKLSSTFLCNGMYKQLHLTVTKYLRPE